MDEPIQHDEMAAQMLLQFNQSTITVKDKETDWKGVFAKADLATWKKRAEKAEAKVETLESELTKERERRGVAEKWVHLFRLRIKKLWEDLQRREEQ